ncbi:Phosphoglucomutase [bioreactor metagenome]|uniref:Phosphoglucomutase n=1 Tax=bioreactor metagenome TaxID=1076179 RepID=A0A644XXT2_9ZZZZ
MNIKERINQWLSGPYDDETKNEIRRMQRENNPELQESFYSELDFGTGGLRGIMGVGPNRMNKYTVGTATQGLANYLKESFSGIEISVAIAYDCRNNSEYFAAVAADVLSANGIKVFLFDGLRPTPELSFTVRHLRCQAGIVITASHNPKEYNGYKVYWNDGGQLVPPHDKNVITAVRAISGIELVSFEPNADLITRIGKGIDEVYLRQVMQVVLSPESIDKQHRMPVVYTPLHGTGVTLIPKVLKRIGFGNIIHVPEQDINDGNFPTVKSPNPEEKSALEMAIAKAEETQAALILATDPDADRVGVAVRNKNGEIVLLNGNQTASILAWYTLSRLKETGKMPAHPMMVKTIVTTDLLSAIAEDFGVKMYDVLTGFKYIAEIIRLQEGKEKFVGGGEESYGYLGADFVRDKDAVMTCCMIAEAAAWAACQDKTLLDILDDIYLKYGYYAEDLLSLTKKGMNGQQEIAAMMKEFRENPPKEICGSGVIMIKDYKSRTWTDYKSGTTGGIDLPVSDVLQFCLADGSKVTVRPSGTEPKIKFYFSVVMTESGTRLAEAARDKLSKLSAVFNSK